MLIKKAKNIDVKIKTVYVEIDKLVHDPDNPRVITPVELEALKTSIIANGFLENVIVNKHNNMIISGHQRTRAAKDLGMNEIPVTYISHLETINELRAANIAFNKTGGDFVEDLLLKQLKELDDSDLLSTTGFTDAELMSLKADSFDAFPVDTDKEPKTPDKEETKEAKTVNLSGKCVIIFESNDDRDYFNGLFLKEGTKKKYNTPKLINALRKAQEAGLL